MSQTTATPGLHVLPATPQNCHWGYFDAALPPALRIKSGDIIHAETVTHHAGDAPDLLMDDAIRALYAAFPEEDRSPGVHLLTGPIFVEGARPGDVLEVRYLQMTPRLNYGSNLAANWGYLYKEFGETERVTIYEIDPVGQTVRAVFGYDVAQKYLTPGRITPPGSVRREPALEGIAVPARLHLGTAGVAPDAVGRVSTVPPGPHGGNMDNWRIAAGTTAYYPVMVEGGLFSVGDAHLAQGDGELSGTGIEASVNVVMQIVLRTDLRIGTPLLETPDRWFVHGFGEDLDEAMRHASNEMLRFLTEQKQLSANDAYSLMSIAADFGITQVVDGPQGVHASIPRGIFPARRPG